MNPAEQRAVELSQMFAEAGWMPSTENFADRPFVKWHGSFFSVAGFPPGQSSHSTVRRTDEEVIAFLNSFTAKVEEPEPVAEVVAEPDPAPVAEPVDAELTAVAPLSHPDEADERDDLINKLREENDRLRKELEARDAPVGLPPNPAETKLSDYGEVGEEADLEPDHLLDFMRADKSEDMADTGDIIAKLSSAKRKRFTELLNVELAELQQMRGAAGENLTRETEIEKLLGLFARVGEM